MSRSIRGLAVALGLTLVLSGLTTARSPVPAPKAETCNGDFGTSIQFLDSPQEAAKAAKKDGQLVFVLHVSGHFEKPEFT